MLSGISFSFMDKPLIYLVFTDDWELRGDGSGDIERIQFEPMRRLLDIFERHGMRCTFMAEVMQQLTFRARQGEHPELRSLADAWDEHVRDAYRRGHDVQLHLHTQWSDANYENGTWRLDGSWSVLNYSAKSAAQMIADAKAYLERVLGSINDSYRCVAFRASYLAAAPSPTLLSDLANQGIEIDSSISGGLRVDTEDVQIDYTTCDEDFQPYFPRMTDARRVSKKKERIVCLPIFHFTGSRISSLTQVVSKARSKLKVHGSEVSYTALESSIGRESLAEKINKKVVKPLVFGKHHIADVSKMDLSLLREMLSAIRSRAKASGLEKVPVVVTNHTKYMTDLDGLDRFLAEVARRSDIKTATLTEVAAMLRKGEFEIRTI